MFFASHPSPLTSSSLVRLGVSTALIANLAACGGGSTAALTPAPAAAIAHASLLLRDAASENWATVGVKVLSVTLSLQGGGTTTVYSPPTPALVNLAQLDQVADLLNGSIPPGTYTGATITLAANPGDVTLTVGNDPDSDFLGQAGSSIASSQIQINGATGASGALQVPINLNFATPLTVSTTQATPVEIDFNLGHPAFVISTAVTGGNTIYTVSFDGGTVSTHTDAKITDIVLHHSYGSVASVSADYTSLTLNRETPTLPIVSPETFVATGDTTTLLADAVNGTAYYDLDVAPLVETTIKDFSSLASTLPARQVRAQLRYLPDGTLVATRLFVSNSFDKVWLSPEGHVRHVDLENSQLVVADETGSDQRLTVDANTNFVLPNQPANAPPIGTGSAFLPNLVRGFKVHVTVDPITTTLAKVVEVETAAFSGRISSASASDFTMTSSFHSDSDNYSQSLPYIATATANGTDPITQAPISGFKYWNFLYPTLVTYSNASVNAITNFVALAGGSVSFGGTARPLYPRGETHAVWGDPANPTGWAAPWVALTPTRVPFARVASGLANGQFAITVPRGTNAVPVAVGLTSGDATLVYGVSRSHDATNMTPQDVTTASGLAALTAALTVGAPVTITAIPQADGTLKAYTITYFTGDRPDDAY